MLQCCGVELGGASCNRAGVRTLVKGGGARNGGELSGYLGTVGIRNRTADHRHGRGQGDHGRDNAG